MEGVSEARNVIRLNPNELNYSPAYRIRVVLLKLCVHLSVNCCLYWEKLGDAAFINAVDLFAY